MGKGIDGASGGGYAGSVGFIPEREIEEGCDGMGLGLGVLGGEELDKARDRVRVRPDRGSVRGARLGEPAEPLLSDPRPGHRCPGGRARGDGDY